jgi:hypothetical protein
MAQYVQVLECSADQVKNQNEEETDPKNGKLRTTSALSVRRTRNGKSSRALSPNQQDYPIQAADSRDRQRW